MGVVVATGFPRPVQSKNVPAGKRVTVWELEVPPKSVAFIEMVANDWEAGFEIEWLVDGRNPMEEVIKRQIATFTSPLKFDTPENPPYIAQNSIKWVYLNTTASDREMEVLCNGRIFPKNYKLIEAPYASPRRSV